MQNRSYHNPTTSPQTKKRRRVKRLADEDQADPLGRREGRWSKGESGKGREGAGRAGERLQSGKDATRQPDTVITASTLLPGRPCTPPRRTLKSLDGNLHLPPSPSPTPLHPAPFPPSVTQLSTPPSYITFQGRGLFFKDGAKKIDGILSIAKFVSRTFWLSGRP